MASISESNTEQCKDVYEEAIMAVCMGMSYRAASKKYNIPRTTLRDHVKCTIRPGKPKGIEAFLTNEEESSIVK